MFRSKENFVFTVKQFFINKILYIGHSLGQVGGGGVDLDIKELFDLPTNVACHQTCL